MHTDHKTSLEADALMTICVAMVKIDHKVHTDEIARLRTLAYLNPMYKDVENVDEYVGSIAQKIAAIGDEAALEKAIASLSIPLRETAYAWAAEMAHADSRILNEEHRFLSLLKNKLGLHGRLVGNINAVTAIRNRTL